MFTIGKRLTREDKRKIQRWEANATALCLIGLLVVVVAVFTVCGLLIGNSAAAKETDETRGAEPEPTAYILPIDVSNPAPVSLSREEILRMTPVEAWTWQPAPEWTAPERKPEITAEAKTVRYLLEEDERDLLEREVMAEAGAEDFDGQCLVAQCILNSAEAYGIRPTEVLERDKYTTPAEETTDSVKRAVAAVFDDGYTVTNEPVRWFYAPKYSKGEWHESALVFVLEHGGHKFFKEG